MDILNILWNELYAQVDVDSVFTLSPNVDNTKTDNAQYVPSILEWIKFRILPNSSRLHYLLKDPNNRYLFHSWYFNKMQYV